ncbi:ChaN family lipoprotein [Antarcticimicrobium sediminis]|uniref:Haem-binding uptake Tiki superfamily ChaN domain-containing protein n=1 Tax=Antarcticimicrobium sediminis TaxID=2546227 RepID=A0A4R5EX33_9RHOB|nr:ChaN family lipoprotein [Antarcticimicrobium sediminis]TDE39588.1 hypothetical protein E1B25_05925 [Antarcticimicrobium sediminis]
MIRFLIVLSLTVMARAAPVGAVAVPDDVLAVMARADVVFLGEIHDNPAHHRVQAAAVAALAPRAVVWEMLTAEQAAGLDAAVIGDPLALEAATGWASSGWPPLAQYLPVFQAAAGAVHYGALVPRSAARAVMETGAATAFGEGAARYGLGAPLPQAEQAAREADQMENHCNALPEKILPDMVDIQRLRDAVLARTALRALNETGGPVAVITGNGHARADRGAPVYLRRAAPDVALFTLGQSEAGQVSGEFDAVLDGPATERPDPCAAFSKGG